MDTRVVVVLPVDRCVLVFDDDLGIPVRVEHKRGYRLAVQPVERREQVEAVDDTPRERQVGAP